MAFEDITDGAGLAGEGGEADEASSLNLRADDAEGTCAVAESVAVADAGLAKGGAATGDATAGTGLAEVVCVLVLAVHAGGGANGCHQRDKEHKLHKFGFHRYA